MAAINVKTRAWIALLVEILIVSAPTIASAQTAKIRIGTYDSRFVALAFWREDNFKNIREFGKEIEEELQKARKAGDDQKVKELEAQGPALQHLMHWQGFGGLSIRNIMATIEDQLPAIAQKADVSLIVSKWEIYCSDPGIEQIDLTLQLVELF